MLRLHLLCISTASYVLKECHSGASEQSQEYPASEDDLSLEQLDGDSTECGDGIESRKAS
jgi:hypothetical protein